MKKLILLTTAVLMLFSCNTASEPAKDDYSDEFLQVYQDFDEHYSYFEYKNIDWEALKRKYEPRVQEEITYNSFLNDVLAPMLSELDDIHVSLYSRTGEYIPLDRTPYTPNYDYGSTFSNYFPEGLQQTENGAVYYGETGSWGYILITTWSNSSFNDFVEFKSIWKSTMLEHDGLIIDVRPNGGGNDWYAEGVARNFTDTDVVYEYTQYRNGPEHDDFSDLQARTLSSNQTNLFLKPTVVLIGPSCASSNESFILMMDALDHVTTIGDVTMGASGNPQLYELPDGTSYRISSWIAYDTDMNGIEDNGITPNILISSEESIVGNRDMVLERAVDYLDNL